MLRFMCKSKIHRVRVTEANLRYEGSLTVDERLMEEADILPYEKVQVVNVNNGSRLETYVIPGERDSGVICLNGAAARLGQVDDIIIIISYGLMDSEDAVEHKPTCIFVDEKNHIMRKDR